MPEPWTTSASASIGADGIVTLVEGSAFCISSRSGEIDPVPTARAVLSRHPLHLGAALHAERGHSRTAWPRPRPIRSAACSCCAVIPSKGHADSHLVLFRRRYVGRGMREDLEIENYGEEAAFCSIELLVDADFADLFEVKEGRVAQAGSARMSPTRARGSRSATSATRSSARRTSTSADRRASSATTSCTRPSFRRAGDGRRASR